jgi:ribosomal protein L14E/L6E/L27E
MADESFDTNLAKLLAAELYFLLAMTASRELYGKSYFALGVAEKTAIDQLLLGSVAANFQALTPETLMAQVSQPKAGFQAQVATPEAKKPT